MPTQKTRQAVRKVRFSHPLAYLDPTFILKMQQHEARRTTRHSGQQVTSTVYLTLRFGSAGLRSLLLLTILTPRQVISDNLLIRLIQIIR